MEFFQIKTVEQVKEIIRGFAPLGTEGVRLEDALGRVLASAVIVPEDMPPCDRSAMDGYALQAKDTFGASEGNPALLEVTGEVLMGEKPSLTVQPGKAVKIATGGVLPAGTDAVVMVEHTQIIDEHAIQVYRTAAPGENAMQRGEDLKGGEQILEQGHLLRPQDLGLLALLGSERVQVYRQPRVGIIATGDELVSIDATPAIGQLRDTNTYTAAALTRQAYALPHPLGIVKDDLDELRERLAVGLQTCDVVAVSGGSSVGTRDLTIQAIESVPEAQILVHGVAVSPGKPTILARAGAKIIWGLPGHQVSAMVIYMTLVIPSLWRLGGRTDWEGPYGRPLRATASRNIPSAQGREDYIRVKLSITAGELVVTPLFGKSGSISTMVKADGFVRIGMDTEGVQEGEEVEVWPF
ncbi:MAG: molybdopterin molybdenumtransferase MoeA [Deltaproteobacteria bacterium RBG_13_52_11]|nr:MAG: molybdopterin molybdenumtransferase MoeA [Deltaproteobacteria bacterium RBG_13_52_11]